MIDWLVYLVAGGFAGGVGAFIFALFKVGPGKQEFNFGKCVAIALVLTWGGPFGYVEVQTRMHKVQLMPAINDFFNSNDCPLEGSINYVKVLSCTNEVAYVYLVGKELQSWGGHDTPLLRLKLKKKSTATTAKFNGWEVVKTDILRSDRLQKDSIVWPPYQ